MEKVEIGPCTLIRGDSERMLAEGAIPAFDALISDPPYGIGSIHSGRGAGFQAPSKKGSYHGNSKPVDPKPWILAAGKKPVALMGADHFAHDLPPGGRFGCWDKSCGAGSHANFIDAEMIWMNRRTPRNVFRNLWMGCLRDGIAGSAREKRVHISQKPVELMCWLIEQCRVRVGRAMLDPYMGSASTGVACMLTGRKFVGIEIERPMFEIACDRIQREWDRINGP